MVQVLYGSSGGLAATGGQLWSRDSPGIAGVAQARDGFGAAGNQVWSQDTPGVAGGPEFLDFFGQTLAAS